MDELNLVNLLPLFKDFAWTVWKASCCLLPMGCDMNEELERKFFDKWWNDTYGKLDLTQ